MSISKHCDSELGGTDQLQGQLRSFVGEQWRKSHRSHASLQVDWLYLHSFKVLPHENSSQVIKSVKSWWLHFDFILNRSGQCWVFAGVAVSLLRALGIACRPVTCYNAAHYCQKLSQAERYFSIDGDLIHDIGRDQIW